MRPVVQQRVQPHAREPALIEQRHDPRQRSQGGGLEVVVLGSIVEHHDRAVDERSAEALHDGLGASSADAIEAS